MGWVLLTCSVTVAACGSHGTTLTGNHGGGGSDSGGGGPPGGGAGGATPGLSVTFDPGTTATDGVGLGCPTTMSGTVFDPAGTLPLYNVVVYVPRDPLLPIADGASCETCGGDFSGRPAAAALSDEAGKFTLDISNIDSTTDVPLVIQVGKWRRQVTIPKVTACKDTPIDASLTRLPRNKSEGNLPKIAVVRGGSDALECLVRKLGVDDKEFTTDAQDGRVHLYYHPLGTATAGTGKMATGAALTTADVLYSSLDKLKTYDIVMMACQGSGQAVSSSPLPEFLNVRAYADQGGRIFGSHYNSQWISWVKNTPLNPYPSVVQFASSQHGFTAGVPATGAINSSFPKGKALQDWLVNTGASTTAGQIPILDGEHTIDKVTNPSAQEWIAVPVDDKGHTNVVQYFSFPTPIDGAACGRMVFSDLHVASGTGDSGKVAFPSGCVSANLSPQEKALAFMFFDLASCVQAENDAPTLPTIPK